MAIFALSLLCLFGATSGLPSSQIIGGEISEKGRWPWMLSLQRYWENDDEYRHNCGAALLTPTWVLTAAHCVYGYPSPDFLRVAVGGFNVDGSDSEDIILFKRTILHEDFVIPYLPGMPDDIAVAELVRPVNLSLPGVGLAKLPRQGDNFVGNPNCVSTGWGRFNPDNQDFSEYLKEINAPVRSKEECQQIWENFRPGSGQDISDQHVCFAGPDVGTCNGDSGSPLQCDVTGNGDWVLAGITSWGTGSTCQGATSVLAGVEPFLDWIYLKVPGLPGSRP